ncbi:Gfo/Idh/MocA family protein [Sporomusa malonica]|uniref:Predicted dehydrogenase n=1 Tax=Sporomusa malonica TaxID=112901 RepID=A0A1W1YTI7_9FIRM|nr:Gfo/Idh/MocA family oxidoreductase [Sporomusa malonica]SMC39446.1 Predicted dehydrogenase [Sporomusa malonica]
MNKVYKIGVIGLGSIGIRHIQNIASVLKERGSLNTIDLIRSGTGKEPGKEVIQHVSQIFNSCDPVPDDYDVIFVTNPTHLHFETIQKFVSKTKHMFIEKPVFNTTEVSLNALHLKDSSIYYVACPLRYTHVIQYLKHLCDLKKIYCARVICSSYLPNWRPDQDYRNTYSAHKKQGGGASIDLIHEWDYLCYLFGPPDKVLNIRGTFSNLEIDSDDLSIYIAKYADMAIEVHLDYFGRKTIREIQIFTEEDTIIGDIANSEIRYLMSGEVISFNEQRNDFQRNEIAHFFDIVEGVAVNDNDIPTAFRTLHIAREGK